MSPLPVELGTKFKDQGIEYYVCCVLNDRSLVSIPTAMVDDVKQSSGIEEILWPLGAYVIFQPAGMTLSIFGRVDGELVHRGGTFEMGDETPALGMVIWNMWTKLRDTTDDKLQENLQNLVQETLKARETCADLTPEALNYFRAELARQAASHLKVSESRVQARLYYVESGYVAAELYLEGQLLSPEDERHKAITAQFQRYLSTAKPN